MIGGASPDRVHGVVVEHLPGSVATSDQENAARHIVDGLIEAGYVVVRAGHVPRPAELDDVQLRMREIGNVSGGQQAYAGMVQAARQLGELRRLATAVLGLDLDDVDDLEE